jgi:hypothetical protein
MTEETRYSRIASEAFSIIGDMGVEELGRRSS